MNYDDKPWLKFYDSWVKPELAIPETSYAALLEKIFADFADHPAYYFLGTTATFRQLDISSAGFAGFLSSIGCEPGQVVSINLPNTPQFLIAMAGTLRAGCIVNGLSPLLTAKEMKHQLNDCGARVLVTMDAIFEQKLLKIQDSVPRLSHIVATNVADYLSWPKRPLARLLKKVPSGKVGPLPGKSVLGFKELPAKFPARAPAPSVKPDDTCLIQYTGGTTGLPKGTELSHKNMLSNIFQFNNWFDVKLGQDISLSGFPFFHLAGLATSMGAMVNGCAQTLIPDPRNTKMICREFVRHPPTVTSNVPTLYQMLLKEPRFKTLDFSQLKGCISGAAPFPVESFRALARIVGEGKLVEVYGMTETSPLAIMNPYKGNKKIGSVGVPIQNTRVKLVDLETGNREVPIGEEGELIVQGPQVMKGYLGKPQETAHALREFNGEKWLHTGDVARMDQDGYFFLVDRAKDMLNVSGYKVFSREVEETLGSHPAIELCAIIAAPDQNRPGNERVKAVIQLRPAFQSQDQDQLKKEILNFCRENMAPYKTPKIIEFTSRLPLTPIGKVDKKLLRQKS